MTEAVGQFWADIELIRNILSWGFFLAGGISVVSGAIGIVRFPDFYTRLHAAGVTDTGGAELILIGMLFQAPTWIVAVKILFIGFFLFFTSPVATHAIAHAAWMVGFRPLEGPELRYKEEGE
ncbi:monovalent cation/H(+) antiporter subunit G [Hyphococcus luteus]|uniref:monovalent cation/H(+) antiporter subunit G n=1 Tax=Hyphococcus luteus TaxID=2058213 RepID=UPI001FAF96AF|nr:monovalent cation/H(+) antiporter subunit G [Marinicaulis flavus]